MTGTPAIAELLSRLEGVRSDGNGGYLARCLCHDDHNPSLHLWTDHEGRVAWHCFGDCDHAEVGRALGIEDHDDADDWTPRGPATAQYRYEDENGRHLFTVCRTIDKQFPGYCPDPTSKTGKRWRLKGQPGVHGVPYHLPRLVAGVTAGATINLVDGEKDVEAVERAGGVATTAPHWAGEWHDHPEYSEYLRGADVVIWRDKDGGKGQRQAAGAAAALQSIAASVRIIEAAQGKDAADHLAAGLGLEDFVPVEIEVAEASTHPGAPATVQSEATPLVLEAALTEVLANEWRGTYRWSSHEKAWRRWTGRVWKKASEPVVVTAAQKVLRGHYGHQLAQRQSAVDDKRLHELHKLTCRHASVLGGLAFLKGEPGFHTEFEEWDADPYTVNAADGLLDMHTRTLRPHDPEALCTKITRWPFGSRESTGAWDRHLRRCLPDEDVRRQVQRDLGVALVGTSLEESLSIWYGRGANGKSTTERAVQLGVHEYCKQAAKDLLVASKFERHPTDIADLAGSRLVFSEEVKAGAPLDVPTVKNLTGGGRKKAHFMRADNFEFEQTFSIFLLVNDKPVITSTDLGTWRRLRLEEWPVSIPFTEQRPQDEMVAELVEDGAWMLRWMVAGFADWQADHHWVAESVKAATAAYEAEQDALAGFLGRRCVLNAQATVSVDQLHEAYIIDTMENGDEGVQPLTKIAFGKRLKSRNLTQAKATGGVRVWRGIALVATSGKNSG